VRAVDDVAARARIRDAAGSGISSRMNCVFQAELHFDSPRHLRARASSPWHLSAIALSHENHGRAALPVSREPELSHWS
jgi:hypothetical protein